MTSPPTLPDQAALEALAAEVGALLLANGQKLATAESCTGGWVAQCLTAIVGSSDWFERGFVTYSNDAKQEMLGVARETLDRHGAVSVATAQAMAQGALRRSRADWSVARLTSRSGRSASAGPAPTASPPPSCATSRVVAQRCARSRWRTPCMASCSTRRSCAPEYASWALPFMHSAKTGNSSSPEAVVPRLECALVYIVGF